MTHVSAAADRRMEERRPVRVEDFEKLDPDTVYGWIAEYLLTEKHYNGKWFDIEQRAKRSSKNIYELLCEIENIMTYDELLRVFTSHISIEEAGSIAGDVLDIEPGRTIFTYAGNGGGMDNARNCYFWHPLVVKSAIDRKILGLKDQVFMISRDLFERTSNYVQTGSSETTIATEKDFAGLDVWTIVTDFVKKAIQLGVTDIHMYPVVEKDIYRLRYRILGDLVDAETYTLAQGKSLLTVIQNQAKKYSPSMKVDEVRKPLDGKIIIPKEKVGWHYDVDLRVSIMWKPDMTNADVVLRILAKSDVGSNTISHLGFCKDHVEKLETAASRSRGIILVTGATGTGKSKTVNTLLASLASTRNILAIEDPIEYLLPNGRQFQVFEGEGGELVGFAELARQCKRHDPDVIFIGELRDRETVETAMHLSKTGHLVLATLHVARATMIPQVLVEDYGVSVDTLADNLVLGVNQVLVKRLCQKCKTEHIIDKFDPWVRKLRFPNTEALLDRLRGKKIYQAGRNPNCSCAMRLETETIMGYSGRTVITEVYEFNPKDFESGKISSFKMEEVLNADSNILNDALTKIENGELGFEVLRSLL